MGVREWFQDTYVGRAAQYVADNTIIDEVAGAAVDYIADNTLIDEVAVATAAAAANTPMGRIVTDQVGDLFTRVAIGADAEQFRDTLQANPDLQAALEGLTGTQGQSMIEQADAAMALQQADPDIFRKLNELAADPDALATFLNNVAATGMVAGDEPMTAQAQADIINELYNTVQADPEFLTNANNFMATYGSLMTPEALEIFSMGGEGADPLETLKAAMNDPLLSDPAQQDAIVGVASDFLAHEGLKEDLITIMGGDPEQTSGFDLSDMRSIVDESPDFLKDLDQLGDNEDFREAMQVIADNPVLLDIIRDEHGEISQESMIQFIGGLQDRMEADPDYMAQFNVAMQAAVPILESGAGANFGFDGTSAPGSDPLDAVDTLIDNNLFDAGNLEHIEAIAQALEDNPGLTQSLAALTGGSDGEAFNLDQISEYMASDPDFLENLATVVQAEGFADMAATIAGNENIMQMLESDGAGMSAREVAQLVDGLAERAGRETPEGGQAYFVKTNQFLSDHGGLINQGILSLLGDDTANMDLLASLDMGMGTIDGLRSMVGEIGGLFGDSGLGQMLEGLVDTLLNVLTRFAPTLGQLTDTYNRVTGAFDGDQPEADASIDAPDVEYNNEHFDYATRIEGNFDVHDAGLIRDASGNAIFNLADDMTLFTIEINESNGEPRQEVLQNEVSPDDLAEMFPDGFDIQLVTVQDSDSDADNQEAIGYYISGENADGETVGFYVGADSIRDQSTAFQAARTQGLETDTTNPDDPNAAHGYDNNPEITTPSTFRLGG